MLVRFRQEVQALPRRVAAVGAALVAALLLLAACGGRGGSSAARHTTERVTVPAYDAYPPDTIAVPTGDPHSSACHVGARAYVKEARLFVAHSGPKAAYPADLYYVLMRETLADFQARHCDPRLLGRALLTGIGSSGRTVLVTTLPDVMARALRAALEAASASGG